MPVTAYSLFKQATRYRLAGTATYVENRRLGRQQRDKSIEPLALHQMPPPETQPCRRVAAVQSYDVLRVRELIQLRSEQD
jgi:hypothetical protein